MMAPCIDIPGYLMTCHCGHELRAIAGQAGSSVICPACGRRFAIPSLSALRRMPILAGLVEGRRPFQFSLQALLLFVTWVALSIVFGKAVGFVWLFLMLPVGTFLGIVGAILPRPVVYSAVLTSVLLLLATIVTCALAAAREDARRSQCMDNLKQLGLGYQAAQRYNPTGEHTIYDWAAEQGYRLPRPADER